MQPIQDDLKKYLEEMASNLEQMAHSIRELLGSEDQHRYEAEQFNAHIDAMIKDMDRFLVEELGEPSWLDQISSPQMQEDPRMQKQAQTGLFQQTKFF